MTNKFDLHQQPKPIIVDPLSAVSLRIEVRFGELVLGHATGFTCCVSDKWYLITNWHVVTGRHPDTGKCLDKNLAVPDRLRVAFHARGALGTWIHKDILLQDEAGTDVWKEHALGQAVDVVAIPLHHLPTVHLYPLDLALGEIDVVLRPAMPAHVIGYPLGLATAESWPIWKTGHLASDPDLDFIPGRPAFLIDATTREGMSGSPVVVRPYGGFNVADGGYQFPLGPPPTKFVGVYAGRIHEEAEVGRVWRAHLVSEIIT